MKNEIQIYGMTLEDIQTLKRWRDDNAHIANTLKLINENRDLRYHVSQIEKLMKDMNYHLGCITQVQP